MASTGPLQEHLQCGLCHNVYRDPHTLRCLHTYCLECITQLQQCNHRIQCPECKDYSSNDVIRQDIKIQAFIDYYNSQEEKSTGLPVDRNEACTCGGRNGSGFEFGDVKDIIGRSTTFSQEVGSTKQVVCEMCEDPEKPIKSKCEECHQFMCSFCDITHRGIRICKNHTVKPIEEEIKTMQSSIKDIIDRLQTDLQGLEKTSTNISNSINEIQKCQVSQLSDINRYIDYLVRDMENYRVYLQDTVKESNDQLINDLSKMKSIVDKTHRELQSRIDMLGGAVVSKDITLLTETVTDVSEAEPVITGVKKIQDLFQLDDTLVGSCVCVEKGEKWDLQRSLRVVVSDFILDFSSGEALQNSEPLYSQIGSYSFQEDTREKLDNVPNRLCLINDELWCAAEGAVYVYSKNCQRIRTIKHKSIQNVHGIVQAHTGHIVLACHSNKGLKIIDSTGKYIGQVIQGSFSDVCVYREHVYALEYNNSKLLQLQYKDNRWQLSKEYQLNYTNGSTVDRVCVHAAGIHLTSFFNHCLYIYSTEGTYIGEKGKEGCGSATPGLLQSPCLCDVDCEGNVLLADQSNHCLKIYKSSNDEWVVLPLPGDMKYPTHAIIDKTGRNLWVVTYNSRQLLKYSKI